MNPGTFYIAILHTLRRLERHYRWRVVTPCNDCGGR